jgi:TorA maturation chaperone TorD
MDANELREAGELCAERAGTYRLFASIFDKEITPTTAKEIVRLGSAVSAEDAATAGERMVASGFAGMADALTDFTSDLETDLAVDYARVFLNAGKTEGQAAIPFESYYTSEEHLLMQDSRDDVRKWYREQDVMPPRGEEMGGEIPDDFIVFELSFMETLNNRIAEAIAAGDRARARELAIKARDFRILHLANWSDAFTKDMVETSQQKFYRYFAKAYRGFLSCERQDCADLIEFLTEDGDDPVPAAPEAAPLPPMDTSKDYAKDPRQQAPYPEEAE